MNHALNDAWPDVLDYDGSRKDIPKNEAQDDYTSLVDHLKELREKEEAKEEPKKEEPKKEEPKKEEPKKEDGN